MFSRTSILLLFLAALGCGPGYTQGWYEYSTGIPLPARKAAHPFALLAASDGRLHLAWISGADRKGAIYTAVFHEKKWSSPEKVMPLGRPCQIVLFEMNGKPHLLECGSGKFLFAGLEKGEWKRLAYPLPKGARQPAVARGPGKDVTLAFIADKKRISRTARPGAIFERAGKIYLVHLPVKGKAGKPRGLDLKSQSRASRPVPVVGRDGTVHVVFERRYGRKANASIAYANSKKRNSVVTVSRQPGSCPAFAIVSPHEMVAAWGDRQGVKESVFDGHQWSVPFELVNKGSEPWMFHAGKNRLYMTAFNAGHAVFYLKRGFRGWSMPLDFGTGKGPGRVVESPDGSIHLIWEAKGTFVHRSLPAPKKTDG